MQAQSNLLPEQEAAHEQSRGEQKRKRQRNLQHNDARCAARPPTARDPLPVSRSDSLDRIAKPAVREPVQTGNTLHNSDDQREHQYRSIHLDDCFRGDRVVRNNAAMVLTPAQAKKSRKAAPPRASTKLSASN